ncbi:hypothetical protein T492DRAFT_850390 [Pavlovales sp. CCMP2436]|nr:hypothetical protein T492DRAFT_850390 [Pavlovales sp. CCMP2436]
MVDGRVPVVAVPVSEAIIAAANAAAAAAGTSVLLDDFGRYLDTNGVLSAATKSAATAVCNKLKRDLKQSGVLSQSNNAVKVVAELYEVWFEIAAEGGRRALGTKRSSPETPSAAPRAGGERRLPHGGAGRATERAAAPSGANTSVAALDAALAAASAVVDEEAAELLEIEWKYGFSDDELHTAEIALERFARGLEENELGGGGGDDSTQAGDGDDGTRARELGAIVAATQKVWDGQEARMCTALVDATASAIDSAARELGINLRDHIDNLNSQADAQLCELYINLLCAQLKERVWDVAEGGLGDAHDSRRKVMDVMNVMLALRTYQSAGSLRSPEHTKNVILKTLKMFIHFSVSIGSMDRDNMADDNRSQVLQELLEDAEKAIYGDQQARDRLRIRFADTTEQQAAQFLTILANGWPDERACYLGEQAGKGRRTARTSTFGAGMLPATQAKAASAARVAFNILGIVGKHVAGEHRSSNPFCSDAVSQLLLSRRKQAATCGVVSKHAQGFTHDDLLNFEKVIPCARKFWWCYGVAIRNAGHSDPGLGIRLENDEQHASFAE